ncbi:MAG TPA: DNA-processing protein DprA [Mycobacteriales bacterium]|nr:DNA-processing protein DprA [Mycobacteriales bacterium]
MSGADGERETGETGGAEGAIDRDRLAAAVLSEMLEPGQLQYYALVAEHGAARALERLMREAPLLTPVRGYLLRTGDPWARGRRLIERARGVGARLVLMSDPEWPRRLCDLASLTVEDPGAAPPIGLWVRGKSSLEQVCERSIALVGARAATQYGTHATAELAAGLVRRGWTVISGAAYGIDGAAHRGALWAEGHTVAVLGCGVDRPYPTGHARLLGRIAETGLIISEWPPGSGPRRHRFLIRNRVIAALARGVVVTEAARRSGSRLTARRAQELDRVVMALPGPVSSAMSLGPHELIRDWQARLVTSAADVIAEVGELRDVFAESAGHLEPELEALAARILNATPQRQAVSVERLAAACKASPRQVRAVLPQLVMRGELRERPEGFTRSAR